MDKKVVLDQSDIVFLPEVLLKYCVFYFGEKEGAILYNYYHDNHVDIIACIKSKNRVYGEKLYKLHMIFKKLEADVFFNEIQIFYIQWPYDKGKPKLVDFELFQLTRFRYYEGLGEAKANKEERLKLGFARTILDLLLPPKKYCLYNHDERYNKNTVLLEQLYAKLKKQNPDILREHGKNIWQFTKDEFSAYIDQKIGKTSQHLINALWYRIKED